MNNYLKTATILYVEDEKEIQDGYAKALQRYAKELILASNGEEGLELFNKHNPDIIITDIKMPKMNGIDMIREIKNINPNQIIIITSAHSDSDYFIDAISMQVDWYLLKPVDKNILKDKVSYFSRQIILEQELKQKEILLNQKEKLASMGEMIGNIAHHWRQPLSVITTSASGMQIEQEAGLLTNEKTTKYLNIIIENSLKLSSTIEEFNTFIDDKKSITNFNINDILEKCFNFVAQGLENNNIELILDINKNLTLNNYENNFMQSIINILNNAIEVLEDKDKKYIFINLKNKDNKIILEIKDNGEGINDEILPKIFEAYTTTKHKYVGTGLGLYTTYNILTNEMNCEIEASNQEFIFNSNDYKGACFTLTLNNNG